MRTRRWIINRFLGAQDRIVAVGNAVRDALVRIEQLPFERIRVIYNGVDPPPTAAIQGQGSGIRSQWRACASSFVVIQVARFDPIKNHLLAIDAMARLVRTCPHAQLWLVGDGPERGRIEAAISAQGLADHVRLLGEHRNVPALLAAADAALLTSNSEGIPLILIEAMASGLPLVSTNVGGVSELVKHDREGWLAPSGDAAAIAQHLWRLVHLPAERHRLGDAGRQRAASFTAQRMVQEYATLYQEMLAQK
jgi:glycosyltransferase involved in cell wall biosynthesis